MNRRAWRCWFRTHEYTYQEVGLDPREPDASARLLDLAAEQFGGNRIGLNGCGRCGRVDGRGLVVLDGTGGTVTLDEYAERRYRDEVGRIARVIEEQHGSEMRVNIPSLSGEPIPLRDALNKLVELDIAASNPASRQTAIGPITFSCWKCKSPITLKREEYRKTVRCPQCGKKQAAPLP